MAASIPEDVSGDLDPDQGSSTAGSRPRRRLLIGELTGTAKMRGRLHHHKTRHHATRGWEVRGDIRASGEALWS